MLKVQGEKIITESNYEVTEPAILFSKTGVFYEFGNYEDLLVIFNEWKDKDITKEVTKDLVFMVFDRDKITLDEVVEIVEKMMSISGYCRVFYAEVLEKTLNQYKNKGEDSE